MYDSERATMAFVPDQIADRSVDKQATRWHLKLPWKASLNGKEQLIIIMITGGYQLPNTIQKAAKNDRELS